jgi:hypothetical protein
MGLCMILLGTRQSSQMSLLLVPVESGVSRSVSFVDDDFVIQCNETRCCVSVRKCVVASASFHPVDFGLVIAEKSSRNPYWINNSDTHVASILFEHGKVGLMVALDQAQCQYRRMTSLSDLSQLCCGKSIVPRSYPSLIPPVNASNNRRIVIPGA